MKENESTFICTHILHIYTSKTDRLSDRVEDWSTKWWKTCQCDDVVLVVDAIMLCVSVLDLLVYFWFHISFFCWQIHFGTDWKSGLLAVNAVSNVHHARPSTKATYPSFVHSWKHGDAFATNVIVASCAQRTAQIINRWQRDDFHRCITFQPQMSLSGWRHKFNTANVAELLDFVLWGLIPCTQQSSCSNICINLY